MRVLPHPGRARISGVDPVIREDCQKLIDAYVDWLRRGLSVEEIGEACELTTPFLDRHNDHLQVYAVRRNGTIELSDDGYTLADLKTGGLEIETSHRKALLQGILGGLGVQSDGTSIKVEASPGNLGRRMHTLVQAMLAINDMFMIAQPRVATFFFEDVREFLDHHQVRYSERVKLAGKTGFDHAIDFLIPPSRQRPERLVQAIGAPKKDNIFAYNFLLEDTRKARGGERQEPEAYAFLNDQEQTVAGELIEALEAYRVIPAKWSERERFAEALAT
ncbi:MAG: DUF1828 domain-containing protein [Acidobacteria bacterium]|nr:MAG: DUF1828 domain-containing protein [Acidobacteriota bacterium]